MPLTRCSPCRVSEVPDRDPGTAARSPHSRPPCLGPRYTPCRRGSCASGGFSVYTMGDQRGSHPPNRTFFGSTPWATRTSGPFWAITGERNSVDALLLQILRGYKCGQRYAHRAVLPLPGPRGTPARDPVRNRRFTGSIRPGSLTKRHDGDTKLTRWSQGGSIDPSPTTASQTDRLPGPNRKETPCLASPAPPPLLPLKP